MNRQDDVEVFTAIVNDNGSLVFVKAGDALSNGYTVVRVEETTVVIADAAGVEQTLRLKYWRWRRTSGSWRQTVRFVVPARSPRF